jgi:hypothetical protein
MSERGRVQYIGTGLVRWPLHVTPVLRIGNSHRSLEVSEAVNSSSVLSCADGGGHLRAGASEPVARTDVETGKQQDLWEKC